jgi:2,4-dienoyl-CoA reductase (NADPH2)
LHGGLGLYSIYIKYKGSDWRMTPFNKFDMTCLGELDARIKQMGVDIQFSEDLSALRQPVRIGRREAPNSLAILPMEGCDGEPDGSPSDLVRRRYRRFAAGGAGLIWYEACAVVAEGRANPLQLHLHAANAGSFKDLLDRSNAAGREANGYQPVNILQLTHSGRYSRPADLPEPMIPQRDPLLDPRVGIADDSRIVADDYLDSLQDKYVQTALLAREAGFDGVDIKACHRYLVSELLASRQRTGRYGGSFANRSRFLLETIRKVKAAVGDDFIVACRFNVFDCHPFTHGFGVDAADYRQPDLAEPLELVCLLTRAGVGLLSNSAGNPYYRFPQVTRPLDRTIIGGELPDEHPLVSVARLFAFSRQIQAAAGPVPVIGNGYSWLRQFIPQVGAANLASGAVSMIGMGREGFAYPDAPRDILTTGRMDPKKCCVACSQCTQIMRDHGRTGCVIRDREVYAPLYQEARQAAQSRLHKI